MSTHLSTHIESNHTAVTLTSDHGSFTFLANEEGTRVEVYNGDNEQIGVWRLQEKGAVKMTKGNLKAFGTKGGRKK